MARNKAINKLRQQKGELSLEEDELFPASTRPGAAGGDHEPARAGPGGAPGALDQMEALDREIFLRHYYYCQTVSAVALELGIEPSTVKSLAGPGPEIN